MLSVTLQACSLKEKANSLGGSALVNLVIGGKQNSLHLGRQNILPNDATQFDCYVINVTGPGIDPQFSSPEGSFKTYNPTCTYPGIMSSIIAGGSGESLVELEVPVGNDRLFQVIGFMLNDGEPHCPITAANNLFRPNYYDGGLGSHFSSAKVVGAKTASIQDDIILKIDPLPDTDWNEAACAAIPATTSPAPSTAPSPSPSSTAVTPPPIHVSLGYDPSTPGTSNPVLVAQSLYLSFNDDFKIDIMGGTGTYTLSNSTCSGKVDGIQISGATSIIGRATAASGNCQVDLVSGEAFIQVDFEIGTAPPGETTFNDFFPNPPFSSYSPSFIARMIPHSEDGSFEYVVRNESSTGTLNFYRVDPLYMINKGADIVTGAYFVSGGPGRSCEISPSTATFTSLPPSTSCHFRIYNGSTSAGPLLFTYLFGTQAIIPSVGDTGLAGTYVPNSSFYINIPAAESFVLTPTMTLFSATSSVVNINLILTNNTTNAIDPRGFQLLGGYRAQMNGDGNVAPTRFYNGTVNDIRNSLANPCTEIPPDGGYCTVNITLVSPESDFAHQTGVNDRLGIAFRLRNSQVMLPNLTTW